MTELAHDLAELGRSTKAVFLSAGERLRSVRSQDLGVEDERALARRAEEARGHHLTLKERSKRAYELSENAPLVRYAVRPR